MSINDFLFVHVETGLSPVIYSNYLAPLGLIQMATLLKKKGKKSAVLDARHPGFSNESFAAIIADMLPRYVGFDLYTDNIFNVARLANIIREVSPSTKIVCGGPHATVCDTELFEDIDADIAVRGMGEGICLELLEKTDLSKVAGITYKIDGVIKKNPDAKSVDIDSLPSPDFSTVVNVLDMPYGTSIITGRGCPFKCAFCAAEKLECKTSYRSIKKVMDDIKLAREQLPSSFLAVLDDTFTVDAKRTEEFCDEIVKIGGGKDFYWYALGRVDTLVKRPALLKKMYDSGLRLLQLGVESGDERVLKAYKKDIALDDVVKLCEMCRDLRLFIHTNFIIGGSFESDETLAKTQKFAEKLIDVSGGYLQLSFPILNPLPGTDIYDHPEKHGIKILDPKLLRSSQFDNCIAETEKLSREQIVWHRMKLMIELTDVMYKKIAEQGPEFHAYCDSLAAGLGMFHVAFFSKNFKNWAEIASSQWQDTMKRMPDYDTFLEVAEGDWKDLIPVRMTPLAVNDEGLLDFPFMEENASEEGSKILDLSAGKLTAGQIAEKLGFGDEVMEKELQFLEDRGAISYRTF